MPHGSRICPHCGALNAAEDSICHRCQQRMPGAMTTAATSLLGQAFGTDFPLTKFFVVLCVTVFVILTFMPTAVADGEPGAHNPFRSLMGAPMPDLVRWGALVGNPVLGSLGFAEPWRYLSAMFVHIGALHIAFNLMALWDFGRATEQRIGSARFAIVFVVTGIVGFLASDFWFLVVSPQPYLTAGASGGLFGLIGCMIGYLYAGKDPIWKQFLYRFAIMTAIFAFALPVNNAAHAGGFLCGAPLGYLAYKENRPWRLNTLFGWVAGILVAASIASVVLSRVYS
jgi:rhomboid protease GluP